MRLLLLRVVGGAVCCTALAGCCSSGSSSEGTQPPAGNKPAPTSTTPKVAVTANPATPATTGETVDDVPKGGTKRVLFKPGTDYATLSGGVVRGERNRYLLKVAAGQTMKVTLTSLENNGAFSVIEPNGHVVAGTEEEHDLTTWTGKTQQSGDYVISVGPTRGNASYTLNVSVK